MGCYIEPILIYGCKVWRILKQLEKEPEATGMCFLRRMLQISCVANRWNETLREADTTRSLINRMCKRQATFFWSRGEKRDTKV